MRRMQVLLARTPHIHNQFTFRNNKFVVTFDIWCSLPLFTLTHCMSAAFETCDAIGNYDRLPILCLEAIALLFSISVFILLVGKRIKEILIETFVELSESHKFSREKAEENTRGEESRNHFSSKTAHAMPESKLNKIPRWRKSIWLIKAIRLFPFFLFFFLIFGIAGKAN